MTTKQGLAGAFNLTKAIFTPATSMSEKRLNLCLSCPLLNPKTERCTHPECGCFVRQKVKLVEQFCPDGKW